jgi:two-component system chemotaxis sensor kinase CheA
VDELLQQFVAEALELTQQAAEDLLALDREPGSRPHIESAFRAFHTLKGSVGLFDLAPMHDALHAAEDILGAAHSGAAELDTSRIDPLLETIEWTERCVRQLAGAGTLDPSEASRAAELMRRLTGEGGVAVEPSPGAARAIPPWAASLFELNSAPEAVALRYEPLADSFFNGDDPLTLMSQLPGIVAANISVRESWPSAATFDPFRSNLIFEALSLAPRDEIEAPFRLLPDQVSIVSRPGERRPSATVSVNAVARTVRVEVERIDRLVDSVGELFTAKNAMGSLVEQAKQLSGGGGLARSIADAQQEFDRLAGQLQRAATGVRMVPLGETFRRLPRLLREVAAQLGKAVDLTIEGSDIEADKAIVDGLYDPLLHMIRNAVDHGIESAQARQAAGKPPRGSIRVRAWQLGYRIELEVSDDGAGVDLDRVRAAAVARGLIEQAQADVLDDEGVHELLFRSGFSTASGVTDISGRGVGMDSVRAAVQRLGGRVGMTSERGRGTTISISLPTSFAMTRVMIVDAAGDRYGVPMDVVSETAKVPAAAISPIRAGEAFILRDRTVPLVRLAGLLGLPETRRDDELVLVANLAGGSVGLVIDAIGERFETMLRPPSGLMKTVPGIAGTTVLGDGRVVMVLDLEALIG